MKILRFVGLLILLIYKCLPINAQAGEPAPTRDATFTLLGVTNIPAGHFVAFCLSNSTPAHFACFPQAIEVADTNGWRLISLTGKGSGRLRKWIGVPEELQPGQAATFMVPTLATKRAWRLVFGFQEQKPFVDPVTDAVRHLTDTNAAKYQDRQFSGRKYFLKTPEVAP